MPDGYQLLQVHRDGNRLIATLSPPEGYGLDLSNRLRADFRLLAVSATGTVELDCRSLNYLSGDKIGDVVYLYKMLKMLSIPLEIRLPAQIREIFELLRLDTIIRLRGDEE